MRSVDRQPWFSRERLVETADQTEQHNFENCVEFYVMKIAIDFKIAVSKNSENALICLIHCDILIPRHS